MIGVPDFWTFLSQCRPDNPPHFDDSVARMLELAVAIPRGSIAWIRTDWPGLTFYLYDTTADGLRLAAVRESLAVTRAERPRDPNHIDWIVTANP